MLAQRPHRSLQDHAEEPAVPRGCLLRRVNADPFVGESIEDPLLMAGFQGNRASAWVIQVCSSCSSGLRIVVSAVAFLQCRRVSFADSLVFILMDRPAEPALADGHSAAQGAYQAAGLDELEDVLVQVATCAAYGSVVIGDAAGMPRAAVENVVAANGLLGTVVDACAEVDASSSGDSSDDAVWLFTCQQQRMSVAEVGIYDDHVAAAQEADEDFFGNFS